MIKIAGGTRTNEAGTRQKISEIKEMLEETIAVKNVDEHIKTLQKFKEAIKGDLKKQ